MKLQPTLSCAIPTVDLASLLQLLEGQRASGTLRCGDLWLRLRAGQVVKSSGDLCEPLECAQETVAALLEASGRLEFRAVSGEPRGPLALAPTALLLEAARNADEARRAA